MSTTSEYRTVDVDLAALLVCRQQRLLHVERPEMPPWLATFVFASTHALERIVAEWDAANGERDVDAREFAKMRVRLYRRARRVLEECLPGHREQGRPR